MGVDGQDNFWRGGGGWIKAIFLYDLGEIAFGQLDLKLLHLNHTLLTQGSFW